MKEQLSIARSLAVSALALTLLAPARPAWGQGTSFGFQGRLNSTGLSANGLYDFSFSLFDSPANGSLLAGPLTTNAVGVTNGLFSVSLDFGPGLFTGPSRWLDIQVRTNGMGSFTSLVPRQSILPTPYSIFAATASNVVSGSALKSLNGLTDAVTLRAGANITISPNGNTLTLSSTGPGGAVWSLNGSSTYYNGGFVGIGTTQPQGLVDINAIGSDTSALFVGSDPSVFNRGGIIHHQSSTYAWQELAQVSSSATDGYLTFNYVNRTAPGTKIASNVLSLRGNGNVGIGTTQPRSILDLVGYQPVITFEDSNSGKERAAIQGVGGTINLFSGDYLAGPTFGNPYGFLSVAKSGDVGIGTVAPAARLDVRGSGSTETTIWSVDERAILSLHSTAGGVERVWTLESGLFGTGGLFGIYDRTAGRARLTIDTNGVVGVDVLQIRGGADLSEHFDVAPAYPQGGDSKPDAIKPGMVVCIDRQHPGKLVVSTQAYDCRVAGIVSGAGGIKPGMLMSQGGSLADGALPVALSGRVYCLVDASSSSVSAGDLLTTSDNPGHAMKVVDHAKAQGAVLGKAMTELKRGQGMVLVLVTLQ